MAIGLAMMFGFRFPRTSTARTRRSSITDFWRRWHMTLSRWFRDYVYIPLGGNRRGPARTLPQPARSSSSLTGLWHGAAWTFVLWGLYHGVLLADRARYRPSDRSATAPSARVGAAPRALTFLW